MPDQRPALGDLTLEVALEIGVVAAPDVADGKLPLRSRGRPALDGRLDLADREIEERFRQGLHHVGQPVGHRRVVQPLLHFCRRRDGGRGPGGLCQRRRGAERERDEGEQWAHGHGFSPGQLSAS